MFGDAMCGYDRVRGKSSAGASTGIGAITVAALAGSTQAQIVTSFASSPATAYDEGTITALSGANSGRDADHRGIDRRCRPPAETVALAGVGRRHVPAASRLRSYDPDLPNGAAERSPLRRVSLRPATGVRRMSTVPHDQKT